MNLDSHIRELVIAIFACKRFCCIKESKPPSSLLKYDGYRFFELEGGGIFALAPSKTSRNYNLLSRQLPKELVTLDFYD